MDLLNKILVVISGILLIALVIYVISISQNAQIKREQQSTRQGEEEYFAPDSENASPWIKVDTLASEDSSQWKETESPVLHDSIVWKKYSLDSLEKNTASPQLLNPDPLFVGASKKILSSVVSIESKMLVNNIPDDEAHRKLREKQNKDDFPFYGKGSGSGIIISPDGYVLTNYHVVENGDDFKIILYDKREFSGTFIGGDPNTDIALLKIEGSNLPAAFIGNSDNVQIGEWVLAIGNPLNFSSTITAGIVSALGRGIRIINKRYGVENFIQTDAVINPGNSGGALINLSGEVIGVNTAIATRNGFYQGYGFAIPINLARKIVNDILKYGEVRRGLLGVSIQTVDSRIARGVGLTYPSGVLVESVEPGSAANKAGLQAGDVIQSVNGETVVSVNDLQNKIAQKNPEEVVALKIWRDRKENYFRIKLGLAPISKPKKKEIRKPERTYSNLGIQFRDLSEEEARTFGRKKGVYVTSIKPGSPASEANLFPKDMIISMNGDEINDTSDLEKKISRVEKGEVIKFILLRKLFTENLQEHVAFLEKK